jgi:arsenite methyltransferase
LPPAIKNSISAYVGCLAGATMKDEYLGKMKDAGFQNIKIVDEAKFSLGYDDAVAVIGNLKMSKALFQKAVNSVASIRVSAVKPKK